MASEWINCRLGDLMELISGYAFKSSDFKENGIPVIKIKNVKAGKIVLDDLSYVEPGFVSRRSDKLVRTDDILITMSGNRFGSTKETWVGKVAQFRHQGTFLLNQRVGILRAKPKISLSPRYCAYALSSDAFQSFFVQIGTSSGGQANLSPTQILGVEIRIPPIKEQKSIAITIGTMDDQIGLLQTMNSTLEAIAQAIFKSWFVDFDPVKAKAEGREPEGMDAATAALFPSTFEDSELGPIPEGWRIKPLRELTAYLNRGITPKYMDDGGVLVLNQKCIRNGTIDRSKGRRHDESARSISGRTLQLGDVLVNSTGVGTLGRVAQVLSLPEEAIVDSHVTVVRANISAISANYLGIALSRREKDIEALATGTTGQTELSRTHLAELAVLLPSSGILSAFDKLTTPMRAKTDRNCEQAETLADLRDALLPKLMSGQLRVPEADALVEQAV